MFLPKMNFGVLSVTFRVVATWETLGNFPYGLKKFIFPGQDPSGINKVKCIEHTCKDDFKVLEIFNC